MKPIFLRALLLFLLGGGHVVAQSPVLGANWTLRHASPTGENLRSIAVNGSASLVAVGGRGTILTTDGVGASHAWTLNSVAGVTADLWDVKDTGSQYVAVGSSSTILTASDTLTTPSAGLTWTKLTKTTFVSTDQFNAVAVNSGLWVAVGATSAGLGVAVVSNDSGTTWARHAIASSTSLKDVVIVPGTSGAATIYAVMNGYLLASSDSGASWFEDEPLRHHGHQPGLRHPPGRRHTSAHHHRLHELDQGGHRLASGHQCSARQSPHPMGGQ